VTPVPSAREREREREREGERERERESDGHVGNTLVSAALRRQPAEGKRQDAGRVGGRREGRGAARGGRAGDPWSETGWNARYI